MQINDKYFVSNIRRYLDSDNPKLGEDMLIHEISEFSCPKNAEVEGFLKNSAIEFTKKSQSVTYLVFSTAYKNLLGYFSLAIKPLTVKAEMLSNTAKRKVQRISRLDEETMTYTLAAYLIAQFGKNYANGRNEEITGKELMELAWTVIERGQYMFGGMVGFLEAEKEDKVLAFYEENRFLQFDTRKAKSDTNKPHELVQMLRLL